MHISKPILLSLIGIALGGAAAVMVGHTGFRRAMAEAPVGASPTQHVSALPCDCPAAEPPLAGRFVEVRDLRLVQAKGAGVQDVICPAGSYLISGSCSTDYDTAVYNVILRESRHSGSPPNGWHCSWFNNEPMFALNFRVAAICLKPAP